MRLSEGRPGASAAQLDSRSRTFSRLPGASWISQAILRYLCRQGEHGSFENLTYSRCCLGVDRDLGVEMARRGET